MHVYIYDSFVNQKQFDGLLAQIETRLTDLGLNGKISRLGAMMNIKDTVANELRRGAKTIIAVGNDQTVNQTVNALVGSSIPLGIIPVGKKNNSIAANLGIDSDLAACDIISARRIERLDLGLANNSFFLTKSSITTKGSIIEIDKSYSIEVMEEGEINIVNLPTDEKERLPEVSFNPQDKKLELYIKTEAKKNFFKKILNQSIFTFNRLTIINKKYPLLLDGLTEVTTPAEIRVAEQKIQVIVGKNRSF